MTDITVQGRPVPGNPERVQAMDGEITAIAAGLRELADRIETGGVPASKWGIEILYNPRGGRPAVERHARQLSLPLDDRGGAHRAVVRCGPKVTYVVYAPKGNEAS